MKNTYDIFQIIVQIINEQINKRKTHMCLTFNASNKTVPGVIGRWQVQM